MLMEEFLIKRKAHDVQGRVSQIGTDDDMHTVERVWKWIDENRYSFYTLDSEGNRLEIQKVVGRDGTRYLTTHPDGVTENNLEELDLI